MRVKDVFYWSNHPFDLESCSPPVETDACDVIINYQSTSYPHAISDDQESTVKEDIPVCSAYLHDDASHRGQQQTLYPKRQRFFWNGQENDVREYNKVLHVFSEAPVSDARAPLKNIITTVVL